MDDQQIQDQIDGLEREREQLRAAEGEGTADADAPQRLEAIGVELDRLWDLTRRRRALADAGGDPDSLRERDAETVENYEQ
jgi:hypothetical protein